MYVLVHTHHSNREHFLLLPSFFPKSHSLMLALSLFLSYSVKLDYVEQSFPEEDSDIGILAKGTGRIEIVREDRLERVYFKIPSVCWHLTKQSKEELMWNVKRDNQQDKVRISETYIVVFGGREGKGEGNLPNYCICHSNNAHDTSSRPRFSTFTSKGSS